MATASRPSNGDDAPCAQGYLVTGHPAFRAHRMVAHILHVEPLARIWLVVPERQLERSQTLIAMLGSSAPERVTILEGETSHLDLGLSGTEYRDLAAAIDCIQHCQQATAFGLTRPEAKSQNLDSMREVLELARALKTPRSVVIHSSALVSGDRGGLVLEKELQAGQSFTDVGLEMLAVAERMARSAMAELPITIVRPSHVVGDTASGETGELDGLNLLFLHALVSRERTVPEPATWLNLPVDMVPIDFVVRAAHCLAHEQKATRRTFHLVNPRPPNVRRVTELVQAAAEKAGPNTSISLDSLRALVTDPGSRLIGRRPKALVDALHSRARYDTQNADELLGPARISCPPLEDYVEALVTHLLTRIAVRPHQPTEETG